MFKKKNPQKANNNFFTKNIQRNGDEFLSKMNARDIQYSAVSLFRDLSKGRVDIDKYGQYFLDPMLLDNCIIEAQLQLRHNSINYNALNWFLATNAGMMHPEEYNMSLETLERNKRTCMAYEAILGAFSSLRMTGDIMYIHALVLNLKNLRPYI